jgi:RNA polymerase sigma-70 factor (ECF subfamily)
MKEEQFRKIVEENYARIYRICYRYFGDRDEAYDACQETLLKVWLNIDKFRGNSSLGTWICRIAVNVCITAFRNTRIRTTNLDTVHLKEYQDISPNEQDQNEDEEKKLQFFQQFLNRLSAADRTLVSLYLEDMDSGEIASVTGLSNTNVRTRIHRIKKQIKEEWEVKNGIR